MSKEQQITIPLKEEVREEGTMHLYLRQRYSEGYYGEIPCSIDTIIGGSGGLLITIGEQRFIVETNDILKAIIKTIDIDKEGQVK